MGVVSRRRRNGATGTGWRIAAHMWGRRLLVRRLRVDAAVSVLGEVAEADAGVPQLARAGRPAGQGAFCRRHVGALRAWDAGRADRDVIRPFCELEGPLG